MTLVKMYDGITPSRVPAGAPAYMGYLNGMWPSYNTFKSMYPKARHVSVTITASQEIGDVLDVETGDATPAQAPSWVAKRRAAGAHWVAVYTNDSSWQSVKQAFAAAKVAEPYWFVAAYPGIGPTLEPGTIAHQYESTADYDLSVVDSVWLDMIGTPAPKPAPKPVPKPAPKGTDTVKLHDIAVTINGKEGTEPTTIPYANAASATILAGAGPVIIEEVSIATDGTHAIIVVKGAPHGAVVTVRVAENS